MKTNCDKQLLVFAEYPWKLFTHVHLQTNPELNGIYWYSVLTLIYSKVIKIKSFNKVKQYI